MLAIFKKDRLDDSWLLSHENTNKHQNSLKVIWISESFHTATLMQGFDEDIAAHILSNGIPLQKWNSLFSEEFVSALVTKKRPRILTESSYHKMYTPAAYNKWRENFLRVFMEFLFFF
jgi:hypothetical protein